MSEPRRKWSGTWKPPKTGSAEISVAEGATIEALRAIAEELEKLHGLLDRVLTGHIVVMSHDEDDEPETATEREHIEKARAARRFADEPPQHEPARSEWARARAREYEIVEGLRGIKPPR